MPQDVKARTRWAWLLLVLALVAMVWPLARRIWWRVPASPPAALLPGPPETPPAPPGYELTLDDQPPIVPDWVPLQSPGMPDVGALVYVDGFTLAIGAPGKYRLRSEPIGDSGDSRRLLWVRPDGVTQVVAVRIGRKEKLGLIAFGVPRRPVPPANVVDPLDRLSPAELHALWGVVVEARTKRLPVQLAALDLRRTCLRIDLDDPNLDHLTETVPLGVRCLGVHAALGEPAPTKNRFPDLARFDALVALEIWSPHEDIDATWFQGMKDLRYLQLRDRPVHAEALGRLTALCRLVFSHYQKSEIAFAGSLMGLEELRITHPPPDPSRFEDLVGARPEAPPFRLPEDGLPALRSLLLLSSSLSDAEVARFTAKHPRCRVRHRRIPVLREALAQVTRIRVRGGATLHRVQPKEETLFEVHEPTEIRRVIEAIDVSEEYLDHDMCGGSAILEFYAGEVLAATLSFHHGVSLRWSGWPSDGELKAASSAFLCDWLKRYAPEVDACDHARK